MNRIKRLRLEHGYTQAQLAKYLNVAQNTLSYWENGKRQIDSYDLVTLAAFLNCSVDYLLGHDTQPQKKTSPSFDELAQGIIGDDADMAKAYNILANLSAENLALALKFLDLLASQQAGSNNQ